MAGVSMYTIAGRQVGSHYLAMACLAGLGGGIYALASGGGSKQEPGQKNTPPINASSSDEADFVKKFLESADKKN
ncbi:hypothetical protein LIA77_07728 [Sarocladium implicatum]|nr:hypothetical protein LIA77_07728 [Sarocladium implicatum]